MPLANNVVGSDENYNEIGWCDPVIHIDSTCFKPRYHKLGVVAGEGIATNNGAMRRFAEVIRATTCHNTKIIEM